MHLNLDFGHECQNPVPLSVYEFHAVPKCDTSEYCTSFSVVRLLFVTSARFKIKVDHGNTGSAYVRVILLGGGADLCSGTTSTALPIPPLLCVVVLHAVFGRKWPRERPRLSFRAYFASTMTPCPAVSITRQLKGLTSWCLTTSLRWR